MKEIKLTVQYEDELIPELDDKIIEFFKNLGFDFTDSSFNHDGGYRDLCFLKIIK